MIEQRTGEVGVSETVVDFGVSADGLDASVQDLGGVTDELVQRDHSDVTSKTEDLMADTIDEVLHQSTEQALRLAHVVDGLEKLGGTVDELRSHMVDSFGEIRARVESVRSPAATVPASAASGVEHLRQDFVHRIEQLELDTAKKLKRQAMIQSVQLILLVAVVAALTLLVLRTPRSSVGVTTPEELAEPSAARLEENEFGMKSETLDEQPQLEPIEGDPPITPAGHPVPLGRVENDEPEKKTSTKKKRRRRRR